jgi:hypothetical protein
VKPRMDYPRPLSFLNSVRNSVTGPTQTLDQTMQASPAAQRVLAPFCPNLSRVPEFDDDALTPTSHDDLVQALAYGLRCDERGKAHCLTADRMAADIVAETLAKHLDQAGFVVMKRSPHKLHSTSKSK